MNTLLCDGKISKKLTSKNTVRLGKYTQIQWQVIPKKGLLYDNLQIPSRARKYKTIASINMQRRMHPIPDIVDNGIQNTAKPRENISYGTGRHFLAIKNLWLQKSLQRLSHGTI